MQSTKTGKKQLALIREAECIGCTKCIKACPVDAIFGATNLMHTVIIPECIGCKLCVPACPVDCIDLVEHPDQNTHAAQTKERFKNRKLRLEQEELQALAPLNQQSSVDKKKFIMEALKRHHKKN